MVGAAAGTLALVDLTLGGVTAGTAAAAPAASANGAVGAQPAAVAAAHGNDNEFDLFENAQFDGFIATSTTPRSRVSLLSRCRAIRTRIGMSSSRPSPTTRTHVMTFPTSASVGRLRRGVRLV